MKFFRKCYIIDAFQWTGDHNQTEDPDWIIAALVGGQVRYIKERGVMEIYIGAGFQTVLPGDWISIDSQGEIRKYTTDVLNELYSAAPAPGSVREALAKAVAEIRKAYQWPMTSMAVDIVEQGLKKIEKKLEELP